MLQLNFDPNLAYVGAAFFSGEEAIVKEAVCLVELSSFREIQDQFEDQRRRRGVQMRVFAECLRAFASAATQETQSLISAEIVGNVVRVVTHAFLKRLQGALGIVLNVQVSEASAGAENRQVWTELTRLG